MTDNNLNQQANFTEVWLDLTLSPPYVLLVVGSIDSCKVIDPRQNNKVLHKADYKNVWLWLLEDEYELAEGRMNNDQLTKETRSCFDCSHSEVWTDRDYSNKDFNGFECTHPNLNEEGYVEPENIETMTYSEFALYCARTCKDYKRRVTSTQE